jgi:ATP-dependent DNA helicase RecQ
MNDATSANDSNHPPQNNGTPARMNEIRTVLKEYWGYDHFRPQQEDIIQQVLQGKDTLALLPTGGGKSICYQVPGMISRGLCLVVSPLIALMKDQVENLRKKGITAYAIYTGMRRQELIQILKTAAESNCKFLYVSPERLESALFLEYLPSLEVSLIAVDEAHCISQWGYDFRPSYLRIAALREELPGVPVLALTASATRKVQDDICEKLQFPRPFQVFRQSFQRPNLSYSVFSVDAKINKLAEILEQVKGSSIVYCKSRRRTKDVSDQLQAMGIKSDYYHAGLTSELRTKKQDAWMRNEIQCVVCTNAFGMGIDKPDVRVVVHFDMPDCIENYYQEAGRAGRDGQKSYAVLLLQPGEIIALREQVAIRYPGLEKIREVYQAIANYLQLPAGSGEGKSFDFETGDFSKKFNLPPYETMFVLKTLEQEGYMRFNEQVFVSSQAQFICNKETLYQFENDNATLEPLITLLLRTYEGIFDRPVNIYERQLAGWLKTSVTTVQEQLRTLRNYLIIDYVPQKDNPQVYLLQPRVVAADLYINEEKYEQQKNTFAKRIEDFIRYTTEKTQCRSQFIGQYFGDEGISACGVCDNCLQAKKAALTSASFEDIRQKLEEKLRQGACSTQELMQVGGMDAELVLNVLQFLQDEQIIEITATGMVSQKK